MKLIILQRLAAIKNRYRFMQPIKLFQRLGLRNQLIILLIAISIFPICILQTLTYFNTQKSMGSKISSLVSVNLAQTGKMIENQIDGGKDLVFQIFTDDEIIRLVKKLGSPYDENAAVSYRSLWDKLSNITNSKDGVISTAIFLPNQKVVCYDRGWQYFSVLNSFWDYVPAEGKEEIYSKAVASEGVVLLSTKQYTGVTEESRYFYHIAMAMYDLKASEQSCIGVIVMSFDEAMLIEAFSSSENASLTGLTMILDQQGNLVSLPEKKYIGHSVKSKVDTVTPAGDEYKQFVQNQSGISDRNYIVNSLDLKALGWTLVNVIDREALLGELFFLQKVNIFAGIIALVFATAIIVIVSFQASKSIRKVVTAMKMAQRGNLEVQLNLDSRDEFSAIADSFNRMMSEISKLVQDVKQATTKQKEAEIRALEAQINPHFIYNTLDSINWMAVEKEEFEISRMLCSFAQILRYSISNSNKPVRVKDEIDWLNQYLYLQQHRFHDSFETVICFDEATLEQHVYKLLLQPFLENAILHGFAGVRAGGLLKVTGSMTDDGRLLVVIEDNGKGMESDQLATLLADEPESDEQPGKKAMGVKNVFDRLRIYYGDEAAWEMVSTPEQGTTVQLVIPAVGQGGNP